jgi:tetratricopeptide (TPR) repeat protein
MKLAALILLSTFSIAGADDKPVRKVEPPSDKLAAAAGEAFAKAKAADEKGDLDDAIRLYRKALAITPHADVYFNLADVQRRKKDIQGAIDSYKKYLELAPDAKDRKEVTKLIGDLEAMPGTIIIEVEESDALVFVDGEPLQRNKDPKNPFVIDMPAGDHVVDVITAISHDNETCRSYHGSKRTCRLRPKPREDGNVVISGPSSMYRASMGRSGSPTIHLKGRFSLEPGKHEIYVTSSRERQCKPLDVNVAKGDSVVTYVWAEVPKKWPDKRGECADVKFKQRVLKF